MWWECNECGSRVEGERPEHTCDECGLGAMFVAVHGFDSHAPPAPGFAEAWFDSGAAYGEHWEPF